MNREGLVLPGSSWFFLPQNAPPSLRTPLPHLPSAHALHFISDTRRGRVFPSVDIINLRQIKSTTRLLGKLRVLIRHLWKSLTLERRWRRWRGGGGEAHLPVQLLPSTGQSRHSTFVSSSSSDSRFNYSVRPANVRRVGD